METKFSAGLTQVKVKTLSEIRSGSRVRSGPDRVTRLRLFPYLGAIGLARLSLSKAKTSPRADFSLIPQHGLG
jgi:hydrogenase maturation factor HypE